MTEPALSIVTAPKRDSLHWKAGTVTWSEIRAWMKSPGRVKEAGNYLLGELRKTTVAHDNKPPCTNLHRRKDAVVSRSAITLDVDNPDPGFADTVEMVFPYQALLHTTFSSSPDAPRYRLIVLPDRSMTPDEYIAASGAIARMLGEHNFDPGGSQPERYMFRPAAQEPGWFQFWELEGPAAPVDDLLADFETDLSRKPAPRSWKRNPFEIDGVIGAFNRAYEDWDLLIETFHLPYEKVGDRRYHLIGSKSQAGMGPVAGVDGFVYSHHAHDPAFGVTCSAFDLVRLHLFGDQDEGVKPGTPVNRLPSHNSMMSAIMTDHRVVAELVGVDFSKEMEGEAETNDWRLGLRLAPRSGKFVDCIQNWDLVRKNDPAFAGLFYNELSLSVETDKDLPWRAVTPSSQTISANDRWEFVHYTEREYGIRVSREFMSSIVDAQAWKRVENPVRIWLDGLVWDRTPRLEECLPGVRPTPRTRLIARKCLVAAVARMFEPGCKWDHTLVLYGPEGVGKSWWIDKMAKGYSAELGNIGYKDTLLTLSRSWIIVSDEGHSLKKVDSDAQKEFLTRTTDTFRMPYEKETMPHPRHCVIWSTTNDETFLRRQEGNRRFLIVRCEQNVDFDALTENEIDQIWAEAVYLYRQGETLYLLEDEALEVAADREPFVEEDSLAGLIQEFLETLVPDDWWERSVLDRQQWKIDHDRGFVANGTMKLDRVCSTQIWVEALDRPLGDHRRIELLAITNILKRLPGWQAMSGRTRVPGYGPQLVFVREEFL